VEFTMATMPSSLVLVGAGKMGMAMLEGWLRQGLDPRRAAIIEPAPTPAVLGACQTNKIRLNPSMRDLEPPAVIVLAVKPQALAIVAQAIRGLIAPGTMVMSILAGKSIADIQRALPQATAIVRAMPNLPASVGHGVTAAIVNDKVRPEQLFIADGLLQAVGHVEWIDDENQMNAVTAVSGSGPAYLFYLAECLAEAGRAAGLPVALAERLAHETIIGTAQMLRQSDLPPAKLRQAVTSPGGTTAAALEVLGGENGLPGLMNAAVAAAKRRGEELGG
jgi:pyrroline-5-carboxylate reductase